MMAKYSAEVGERVGAILEADDEKVRLFGYGVFAGEEEAPTAPFGFTWEEFENLAREQWPKRVFEQRKNEGTLRPKNPKIELDDGRVVWGQECWWGPEERIREMIGDREVEMVT